MANTGVKRGIGMTAPFPATRNNSLLQRPSTSAALSYSPYYEGSQFWATQSFNVMAYGAKGDGIHDDTAAIKLAVAEAALVNGTVYFPWGVFKVTSSITVLTVPLIIQGAGPWQTIIMWYGTGDCFRIYNTQNYSARTNFGGALLGLTIDGTNSTGTSNGLHIGDVFRYRIDITVQNFTQASSYGVLFDNQYFWCEQIKGEIYASNCVTHVGFNLSGTSGTQNGSFERCDLSIYLDQLNAAYDGVTLENGAYISNGFLRIKGNMSADPTSTTAAVLRLTGTSPVGVSGASISSIVFCLIDIGVECGAGNFYPYTIFLDAVNNTYFSSCIGCLNFGDASTMTPCNLASNCGFFGIVTGDAGLQAVGGIMGWSPMWPQVGMNIGTYASGLAITANGQAIATANTMYTPIEGSASHTGLILDAGAYDGQIMVLLNYGSFAQSFAVAGTSNVADGTSDVIGPYTTAIYVWSDINNLWYRATPGATPGTLITRVQYAPSTAGSYTLNVATTGLKALDTTNLVVTFPAPQSGAVLVKLQAWVKGGAGAGASVMFGVVSSTGSPGTLVGVVGIVSLSPTTTAADNGELGIMEQLITGLTPGTSYTWYFAGSYSGTASTVIPQGGAANTTVPTGAPAVMEVWAA